MAEAIRTEYAEQKELRDVIIRISMEAIRTEDAEQKILFSPDSRPPREAIRTEYAEQKTCTAPSVMDLSRSNPYGVRGAEEIRTSQCTGC